MSAERAGAMAQWRRHLAELRSGLETDPARLGTPGLLPPLPGELAASASEILALLRTAIEVTRTERDRVGRELDQLGRLPRAQAESGPVYLDATG